MSVRLPTAAAVLVSGAVHLKLWFDGFRYEDVGGPAFMVNAVAGLVIAVLLLGWRHWVPLFLAVGFGASTLGAFVLATTAGLFGLHDHWEGSYVWAAAVSEAVAIIAGLVAGVQEGWLSRDQLQQARAVRRPHLRWGDVVAAGRGRRGQPHGPARRASQVATRSSRREAFPGALADQVRGELVQGTDDMQEQTAVSRSCSSTTRWTPRSRSCAASYVKCCTDRAIRDRRVITNWSPART